uniref:Uncharacterized protein n=1 Tax=Setaria digitata TaxID=48799 RepID=A0A915PS12_9BILA
MSRQAKLMNKEERKVRGIRLGSKARVGGSRATRLGVSPEIRSLQKGRIKLGSVAPLLSSRAKALAVKEHYKCYSDDEAHHLSDKSGDSSFSENDYGDEFYDVDRDHRSYGSCRTHFHAKSHDELEPSSSFPSPISALVEAPRARKSATITSVSASTKAALMNETND